MIHSAKLQPILLLALITLMLFGCSERHGSFSSFERVDPQGWIYGDTVRILPEKLDSASSRRLSIAVCHTNNYPYRNLWLEVSYRSTDGELYTLKDTVQMVLADIYGRWQGQGFGPSYQMEQQLEPRLYIPDSTLVCVRHIMRVDTLKGIEQVGITINSEE